MKTPTAQDIARAELNEEIDWIEHRLSPENLFWDGERDRNEAMAEGKKLRAKLESLRAKLKSLE